jgi:hypothetical protein
VEVDLRGDLEMRSGARGGTVVRVRFVPEGRVAATQPVS